MTTTAGSRKNLFAGMLMLAVAGCAAAGGNGQGAGGAAGGPGGAAGSGGTGGAVGGGLGGAGSGGTVAAGGAASAGAAGNGSAGRGGSGESGGASGGAGSAAGSPGGAGGGAGSAGGSTGDATGLDGNRDAGTPAEDAARDAGTDGSPAPKDGSTSDAAPQSCTASQSVPKAGDATVTMQSGGRSRRYIQHVPSGLAAAIPLALVIDLHGAGGSGKQQQGLSGFSALADKEKFLAIFPDGIDGYWNVDDKCCGTAGTQKIDDVGFLKAIVAKLSAESCIDARRVYVSGFSNGGGLAHRMGCDAANIVAAIAPTATDLRTQPCNAARPISMMEVKGMADSLEPYEGGLVGPAGGQYVAVGAKASQKLWADIDKCTGSTTTNDKYCASYTQCAEGVEVGLCSLPNTDHDTYGNGLGFNVASVIWSMFKRQPMR